MIDRRFLRTLPRRLRTDEGELLPSSPPSDGNAVFLGVEGADAATVAIPFVFVGVAGADSDGFSESAGTGGGVEGDFGGTVGASVGTAAGVGGRGTLAAASVAASSLTSGFGSGFETVPSDAGVCVETAPSAALLSVSAPAVYDVQPIED